MAKPSIEDVARVAGVSRSTVAQVVNGAANVSAHIAYRVRAAIARLGYIGERATSAHKVFSFRSVSMVTGNGAIHDSADVVGAALQVARFRGFNLVLLGAVQTHTDVASLREAVIAGALDALLVLPALDPVWMAEVYNLGCPVAVLDLRAFQAKAESRTQDLHITLSEALDRLNNS